MALTPAIVTKWLPWALVASLGIWGSCKSLEAKHAKERAAEAALDRSNAMAAADSSRQLAGKVQALLGDSLQAVQRLALQQQQKADALDRALQLERIAAAGLRATIRKLEASIAGAPVLEDTATKTRTGSFDYREPPYTIVARVTLPPPPAAGRLQLSVVLDPVPLQLRLGCGPPDVHGIRPASATLTGPPWATLELGAVEQSPDLCKSPALKPKGPSRTKWAAIGAGVALLARALIGF